MNCFKVTQCQNNCFLFVPKYCITQPIPYQETLCDKCLAFYLNLTCGAACYILIYDIIFGKLSLKNVGIKVYKSSKLI